MYIISKAQFDTEENHGFVEYVPYGSTQDLEDVERFMASENRLITPKEFWAANYRSIQLYRVNVVIDLKINF